MNFLDAKADKDATIDISMEDASYSRYFQQANAAVGTAWKNYSYTFKLSSDADLALKFLTGAAKEAYTLDIDHVVLKIKGAPENRVIFLQLLITDLGKMLRLQ